MATTAVETGGVSVESALGIKAGMHQKEAATLRAEAQTIISLAKESIDHSEQLVEELSTKLGGLETIQKILLGMLSDRQDIALNMSRNH